VADCITPTGIFSQEAKLADLVAASTNFQALVGVTTTAAALKRVHYPVAEDLIDSHSVPRAVIDGTSENKRAKVGNKSWRVDGMTTLTFQALVPEHVSDCGFKEEFNWYNNKIGPIISDMETLAGTGEPRTGETHLNVVEIERIDLYFEPIGETNVEDPTLAQSNRMLMSVEFNCRWF
jgi:hypothetical protein